MTSPSPGPDLAQRRAQHALNAIKAYRDASTSEVPDKQKKAYAGYVKSLPAAIVMNGLGQALATELAQGKKDTAKGQGGLSPDAHQQIYRHVQDWLCGSDPQAPFRDAGNGTTMLLERLYASDQTTYLRAQAEALLYLGWLKKFANALLGGGDEE
ncbi:CRISPR-associated Cmr5 family protein [Nitrospirillum amazonense]|uniref:CRISPR type III-B/RAMP module-associated protein Cmr5 n=1 Tax=Nitrospirillum amazonense TaxID=28077 RepID=A0A560EL29_9PROT|nr:type III-B CRISPR module-associated protein Cmr5 [Nitrospirillum amazonense]TWB10069.1 CRISPR-associated Cmr5 family protein [Nitrospirillum amazonense]